MTIFDGKLNEIIQGCKFWKLFLIRILWNFTSRKFQLVISGIVIITVAYIFDRLSEGAFQTMLLAFIGAYAGLNVIDAKIGNGKDNRDDIRNDKIV